MHCVPEELDDCTKLRTFIAERAEETKPDAVLFLGDLSHTMNIIHVEVQNFWRETFVLFRDFDWETWAIVGNHDFGGENVRIHSLMAHDKYIRVIDSIDQEGGVLMMPYYSNHEWMVERATHSLNNQTKTLICHQTFEGSKYENNFYAPDGIDPDCFPQETIISGHIHTPQSFGKVTYIGAPRWRSLSDANIDRSIVLYEFNSSGSVLSSTPFDTGAVCRKIRHVVDSPELPVSGPLDPSCDWRVDIKGPADWVEKRRAELAGPGVRIRGLKTEKSVVVRESEGIDTAFNKYLKQYVAKYGTPITKLELMAQERLGV